MANRLTLQTTLERLLGSKNVYYQPPSSVKMQYPAIRYSKSGSDDKYADDKSYSRKRMYELIVIDYKPDNPVIEALEELPYCKWTRHYTADNLNHDILTLYY